MKLYYTPGACSLAPHIALRETGATFHLEQVDLAKKQTAGGEDFTRINPKGYVPTLRLDDGEILTEVAVILQYVADRKPESGLAPAAGTMERYRLMEWLNFISSEVHKQFGPFFNPRIPPDWKANQLAVLGRRFDYLSERLDGRPYLMGDKFSVADAYLYTVLTWSGHVGLDMGKWPTLKAYMARVAERPAVREALEAEGLTD